MEITIAGHKFPLYNQVNISLKYDSVSDGFSFKLYFNPNDPVHRKIFTPGFYPKITISHGGVLVMAGTMIKYRFGSAGDPPKQLVYVSGYSLGGVLEKNCIVNTTFSEGEPVFQFDNGGSVDLKQGSIQFKDVSLPDIVKRVTAWYDLGDVIVDDVLAKDPAFNTPYASVTASSDDERYQDMTVFAFLNKLCIQKNVTLSHNAKGQIVLTRPKVDDIKTTSTTSVTSNDTFGIGKPEFNTTTQTSVTTTLRPILYNFVDMDNVIVREQRRDGTWTGIFLDFDGDELHRVIQIAGEQNNKNAADKTRGNPFVSPGVKRFTRLIQDSGTDNDTNLTATAAIKDELKSIVLSIDIQGWTLGGNLVTPNQLITVLSPENHLYTKQKWFIQEVELYGDEKTEKASLICVPSCVFSDENIINNYFA